MANRKKSSSFAPSELEKTGPQIPKPPLEFHEEPQPLPAILQKHSLPCIIQCCEATAPAKERSNIDFNNPLIAFQKRSVRKVSALCAEFDKPMGMYMAVGRDILIPEDYPGWFAMLGHPDDIIKPPAVPHYRTIQRLAITNCTHFLVAGNRPISAFSTEGRHHGNNPPLPCCILPGNVLRKGGIYKLAPDPNLKKKKSKKKDVKKEETFLLCFDEYEREILVPMNQEGLFYIISQDGGRLIYPVVKMSELLQNFKLPQLVKLLYGRVPSIPCAFTDVLLLTDSGVSQTIVSSTLLNYRNINMEIPLGTEMKFYAAKNTPDLLNHMTYKKAIKECEENMPRYVKNMKVPYGDQRLVKEPSEDSGSERTAPNSQKKGQEQGQDGSMEARSDVPFPELRTPSRSASQMSRKSNLKLLISSIIVNTESKDSQTPETPLSQQTDVITPNPLGTLQETRMYQPPKPDLISGQRQMSAEGQAKQKLFQKKKKEPTYDNNEYETPWNVTNSTSSETSRVSTITIPSQEGSPVPHNTQVPFNDPGYLTHPIFKNSETGVTNAIQRGLERFDRKESATNLQKVQKQLPEVPPLSPPPLPERKNPYTSVDVDQPENLFSLDTSTISEADIDDNDSIYINMSSLQLVRVSTSDFSTLAQEDRGAQPRPHEWFTQYSKDSPTYSKIDESEDRNSENPYITPYHKDYVSIYRDGSTKSNVEMHHEEFDQVKRQSTPERINIPADEIQRRSRNLRPLAQVNTDSGVYNDMDGDENDDLPETDKFDSPTRVPDIPGNSKKNSGGSTISKIVPSHDWIKSVSDNKPPAPAPPKPWDSIPPPLPVRPLKPGNLKGALFPADSNVNTSYCEYKQQLIDQLQTSGVRPATELALKSLQVADITALLHGDIDKFDEDLTRLLPKIGNVDLRKIASCLRNMRLSSEKAN